MTWEVIRHGGSRVQVYSDEWATRDGDLVFYNTGTESRQGISVRTEFPVRAFAQGTWLEVSLYV